MKLHKQPFRDLNKAASDAYFEHQRRISHHAARLRRAYPSLPAESITVLATHEVAKEDMRRMLGANE